MRPLVKSGSIAAIGAEQLRVFQNDITHGTLAKPSPNDWGDESRNSPPTDAHASALPDIALAMAIPNSPA